jgi:hypothetical protein
MQNKNAIESFLYNQMKPQIEKSNKHGSYSLWEDVARGDESVCGIYITYHDLQAQLNATNNILHVTFPVTIGFDMLLPLQAFNLFPNCFFGNLNLIVKVSPNALVWSCTDPSPYIADREMMTATDMTDDQHALFGICARNIMPWRSRYYWDHRFTQVRVDGRARCNVYTNACNDETPVQHCGGYHELPLRIDPHESITLDSVSTIMGFSLKDSVKTALATYYREVPFVVPSECIFI